MLLTDEFKHSYSLELIKLENITGINIDFVYILANYALERKEEHHRLVTSELFYKKIRAEMF